MVLATDSARCFAHEGLVRATLASPGSLAASANHRIFHFKIFTSANQENVVWWCHKYKIFCFGQITLPPGGDPRAALTSPVYSSTRALPVTEK